MCIQVLFLPVNCVCAVLFLPVLHGVYAGVVLPVTLCAGAVFTCYSVCVQVLFLPVYHCVCAGAVFTCCTVCVHVCVCRCCFTCYIMSMQVLFLLVTLCLCMYFTCCTVCVCAGAGRKAERA